MPYRIREHDGRYLIQKHTLNGWRTIAHSDTREKAEASIRARHAGEHDKKTT